MASNIFMKYMWLVNIINQNPQGVTYEEINERWEQSTHNYEKKELPKRTFRNWIQSIGENFGIEIECTKTMPYRYYIANHGETKNDLLTWALNAFSIGQMATENNEIRDRILLEDIPSANERLNVILSAMRANHRIRMIYKRFGHEEKEVITEPYAVKLSKKRWYVICYREEYGKTCSYALDRIQEIEELNETFKMKEDYSAERDFEGCIGISAYEELPIEDVYLKITDYLRDYIKTLPLHSSQKLEKETADYCIYSYRLRTDHELVDTICGMGACCEVLVPDHLRYNVYVRAKAIAEKNK